MATTPVSNPTVDSASTTRRYRVSSCDLRVPQDWHWEGPRLTPGDTLLVADLQPRKRLKLTVVQGDQSSGPFEFTWVDADGVYVHRFAATALHGDRPEKVEVTWCLTLVDHAVDGFQALYACTIAGDPEQVGVWGADNQG